MKKILASLLLVISCMFCFTACGDGLSENYWLDTSSALTTYFATDDFNSVLNIDFCNNIDTIIESEYGSYFAELTDTYAPLFEASMFCSQKYANVFTVTPIKNEGEFRKLIPVINSNLENLKNKISDFVIEKQNYEEQVDFSDEDNATSDYEKARLLKFKQEYLKVIELANTLSQSIYNAYTVGYYDFADFTNLEESDFSNNLKEINKRLAYNAANLQLNKSAIKILSAYNAKEIQNTNNKFWEVSQKFFDEVVKASYDSTPSTATSTLLNNFKVWKGVYNEFVEDAATFNKIIDELNINVLNRCYDDAAEYAKETNKPENEAKVIFFFNFYQSINLLYDYTIKLA
ncbi:MAG: hypothetical protein E7376_04555 [Clostridiales bacterium]|nr:hypothetical protein [Clostridiales bacterium]